MRIDEKTKETLRRVKAEEERLGKEAEKWVMIEKAVNLRLMCDYAVSCSYGDIVLIISMLRDYVRLLDGIKENDPQYLAYYRDKFLSIADRLGDQIGYDYDAAVENCRAKAKRREESDIGEDALVLAVRRGAYGKNRRAQEENQKEKEKTEQRENL